MHIPHQVMYKCINITPREYHGFPPSSSDVVNKFQVSLKLAEIVSNT